MIEQLLLPGGRTLPLNRAIVFNSWFTWAQALPASPSLRSSLQLDQVGSIARLARQVHNAAVRAGVSNKGLNPFTVIRWWDPTDPAWAHGRRVLLSLDSLPMHALAAGLDMDRTAISIGSTYCAEFLLFKGRSRR